MSTPAHRVTITGSRRPAQHAALTRRDVNSSLRRPASTASGNVAALLLVFCLHGGGSALAVTFDHGRWERILKANVTEDGWINYVAIRDKWASELKAYLREIGQARVDQLTPVAERVAFWINAYNAVCVQKLIDSGLPDEVPNASLFGKNIFKERTYRVGGKVRSLDDMEHGILRKQFKDNRVHAALVCGASSCPRLRPEPYTGAKLARQLDEECRRWVQTGRNKQGRRKNYLDREKGIYYVSKIFDWFEEDFEDSTEGVLRFLRRYASEADRDHMKKNRVKVRYQSYDWRLNSQPSRVQR